MRAIRKGRYNVLKKYNHGGTHPDVKELFSVMNKMSSSPRTDRRATFEDGLVEEVSPSSFDTEWKARKHHALSEDKTDQELNARDFMQKWMNSKKGMEMLKKSYGDDWESAFVDRHRNTQNAKIAHVSDFKKLALNRETGVIEPIDTFNRSGLKQGDAGPFSGSGHHGTRGGRPYVMGPKSLRDRGVIRVVDSAYPGDKTLTHELSHAGDATYDKSSKGETYDLARNIPTSDIELMEALSQDKGPGSRKEYLATPTESRARLLSLRSKMEDRGYDVFNETITEDMLNKVYPGASNTLNLKDESFYRDLQEVYSDKEILSLLNNIS